MEFKVGKRLVGKSKPVFIIAEIARTYENDLENAARMIKIAAQKGVDAIKIQSIEPQELLIKNSKTLDHYQELESLYRSKKQHEYLASICYDYGVEFLSAPESLTMADLLDELNVPAYKIASLDIVYEKLLKHVAAKNKPMFISTGMATQKEIKRAFQLTHEVGNNQICFLHCSSLYPTLPDDAGLWKIKYLQKMFPLVPIGYSDHTIGITASILSVALGACVIEKHFTLDRNQKGKDHIVAADPTMLGELVRMVREAQKMMGKNFFLSKKEYNRRKIKRRKLVAAKDLAPGIRLTEDDIACKQTDSTIGLQSGQINNFIGKILNKPMKKDEIINKGVIK